MEVWRLAEPGVLQSTGSVMGYGDRRCPHQQPAGPRGACLSDLILQTFGLSTYLLPLFVCLLGWKWVRRRRLRAVG